MTWETSITASLTATPNYNLAHLLVHTHLSTVAFSVGRRLTSIFFFTCKEQITELSRKAPVNPISSWTALESQPAGSPSTLHLTFLNPHFRLPVIFYKLFSAPTIQWEKEWSISYHHTADETKMGIDPYPGHLGWNMYIYAFSGNVMACPWNPEYHLLNTEESRFRAS